MLGTSLVIRNVLVIGVAGLVFVGCAIALLLWVDSQIYVPGQTKISVCTADTIKTTSGKASWNTDIHLEPCHRGIIPFVVETLDNSKTLSLQGQSSCLGFICKSLREARNMLID